MTDLSKRVEYEVTVVDPQGTGLKRTRIQVGDVAAVAYAIDQRDQGMCVTIEPSISRERRTTLHRQLGRGLIR